MDELDRAIEITREYGRKFGVEYGRQEIKERLISGKVFSEKEIELRLKKLRVNSYELTNKEKVKQAEELAELIAKYFKDILLIGVTGSVAAGYPKKENDIDLMIVTKKNRLWLTRFLMRMFIFVKHIPHRKFGRKENENDFCFNLWMEEDKLIIPKDRRNLRNAMDLILLRPILNINLTYENFVGKNDWVKKYVANGYKRIRVHRRLVVMTEMDKSRLARLLNWLVFWPQWWYMKRKIGGELVDQKRAFFHPNRE